MKTFLLSFLMLISVNIFGQTSPVYLRAHTFSMGLRSTQGSEITWVTDGAECSILVECYPTKIIINSQTPQTYHVLFNVETVIDGQTVWRCKNLDGTLCNVKMTRDPKYPTLVALEVEFNDAIWFYICGKG